jgi:branched-chain amino acid transport system ATP-binding protein
MADVILETKGLNVGYGPIHVIYDLDFKATDGEVTVIVGPNGVGKTTLLKAVMGLATVYSGQVFFQGDDISRLRAHERTKAGIGYMPQTGNIFSNLTVEDNLKMAAYTVNDQAMYQEKLEMVMNLFPILKDFMSRSAGTLSGGERQMLAESMVLMRDPKVMLVDEPTAGLMPKLVTDVLKKLADMAEQTGLPIIMVTFEGRADDLLHNPLLTEMYLGAVEVHDLKTVRE